MCFGLPGNVPAQARLAADQVAQGFGAVAVDRRTAFSKGLSKGWADAFGKQGQRAPIGLRVVGGGFEEQYVRAELGLQGEALVDAGRRVADDGVG